MYNIFEVSAGDLYLCGLEYFNVGRGSSAQANFKILIIDTKDLQAFPLGFKTFYSEY